MRMSNTIIIITTCILRVFCESAENDPSLALGVLRTRLEGGKGKGSSNMEEAENKVFLARYRGTS